MSIHKQLEIHVATVLVSNTRWVKGSVVGTTSTNDNYEGSTDITRRCRPNAAPW